MRLVLGNFWFAVMHAGIKKFTWLLVVCVITLTVPKVSWAKAPVWKVSRDQSVLYLGGTIHVLSSADYPLPTAFNEAYQQADSVWFETDIAALTSPQRQAELLELMQYAGGQTLSSELDPENHQRLARFLKARDRSIAAFETLSPFGIMSVLMQSELQKLGIVDEAVGVDLHFDNRARADGKPRLALEAIAAHFQFIQEINQLDPNLMVLSLLDDLDELSAMWHDLLTAWRGGNLTQLAELGIAPLQADFPRLYEVLLQRRNADWVRQLEQLMQTTEVELVLVGALHMAGQQGLVEQLRELGYVVEQLD